MLDAGTEPTAQLTFLNLSEPPSHRPLPSRPLTLFSPNHLITIPGRWTGPRTLRIPPVLCNIRTLRHTSTSKSNCLDPFSCCFLQLALGLDPISVPRALFCLPKVEAGRQFLDHRKIPRTFANARRYCSPDANVGAQSNYCCKVAACEL